MHVQKTYDKIANGFYHIRQKPIVKDVYDFAEQWTPGLLLDIGCANGNCSLPFAERNFDTIGCDVSGKMLLTAKIFKKDKKIYLPVVKCDCSALPFKSNSFDYAISIAVFHHLDIEDRILKAFQEVRRILKPGGKALITVWNKTQPRFIFGKSDVFIPWKHKGKTYKRYYHLFTYQEIEKLAKEAKLKAIKTFPEKTYKPKSLKWFSRNVCILVEKTF